VADHQQSAVWRLSFGDFSLAPQRKPKASLKVTRLPGRTPGTSLGTNQDPLNPEAMAAWIDGGFQPAAKLRTIAPPMITVKMTRSEQVIAAVLFGLVFLYCLCGAVTGDLYLPTRRGNGAHLHGPSAWLVTLAPALIYCGLLIRAGTLQFPSPRIQGACELLLLFGGVASLCFGLRLM
jgi:hypothetical protein